MSTNMREVTFDDYLSFVRDHKEIDVEGSRVSLEPIRVERLYPTSEELTDVSTTVWSFPKRGSWATHRGDYRGNWPPQMARALILMYTRPGETVLDPMVGSGTTCVEAVLLGRNCVGVDINYSAVMLTLHRLYWLRRYLEGLSRGGTLERYVLGRPSDEVSVEDMLRAQVKVYHGDARNLNAIADSSVDLVATHPPYWNIIEYGQGCQEGDMSCAKDLGQYLEMLGRAAEEAYRVLRPGRHMGILIGDTRQHRFYVPITHYALDVLLRAGFVLREEVVKVQHRMKATREVWSRVRDRDFLLIYHEKLFVLYKPASEEERKKYGLSAGLPGGGQCGRG